MVNLADVDDCRLLDGYRRRHEPARRQILTDRPRADAGRAGALRPGLHRHHPDVPVAQGLRRGHGRPGRGRRDALGGRRQTLHSMHSYFMRPVDIGAEVRYEVERAARRPRLLHPAGPRLPGRQAGLRLPWPPSTAGEPAAEFARPPGRRPGPGDAAQLRRTSTAAPAAPMTTPSKAYWSGGRSFDMRHVPGPVYLSVEGEQVPHQAVWVKAVRRAASRRRAHRRCSATAALAYVCDYTILEPVLRVHGLRLGRPGPGHRQPGPRHVVPPRRPRWTTGCCTPGGRLRPGRPRPGQGRFFDRHGRLLATVVQEGMIRTSTAP